MGIRQSRQLHWILLNRGGCLLWPGLYNCCSAKDNDDDNDDNVFHYEIKEYRIARLLTMRLNLVSPTSISSVSCISFFVFILTPNSVLEIKIWLSYTGCFQLVLKVIIYSERKNTPRLKKLGDEVLWRILGPTREKVIISGLWNWPSEELNKFNYITLKFHGDKIKEA